MNKNKEELDAMWRKKSLVGTDRRDKNIRTIPLGESWDKGLEFVSEMVMGEMVKEKRRNKKIRELK